MSNSAFSHRVIDYDEIDDWSPWLGEVIARIAPNGLMAELAKSNPQYVEDARDHVVRAIGRDELVAYLTEALNPCSFRVFHGTRVTPNELESIKKNGLRALIVADRRAALTDIFSQHPDWSKKKAELLEELIQRFGVGWERNGSGRREDGFIHACVSRAGLLLTCNHYLTHGAEVDQHIANYMFDDKGGLALLQRNRSAKIMSFTTPYSEAAAGANPYGVARDELPGLQDMLITLWAYRQAHPEYSAAKYRNDAALRVPAPVLPTRIIGIEHIDDAVFSTVRPIGS